MTDSTNHSRIFALVITGVLINLAVGWLVSAVKLPFFLDSIGTVLITAIAGLRGGIVVGLATVLIGSLYIPTLWAYAGTAVVIALFTSIMGRFGFVRRIAPTIGYGLLLGVVTAIVSAPVTAFVWQGVSLAGSDVFTALFAAAGKNILDSVILGGLSTDPIDKLITSLVALSVLLRLPTKWKEARSKD
jgi:energy-coupling factor transport system substrate-specific component